MLEIPDLSDGQLMLIQRDIAHIAYEQTRTVRYNLRIRPDLLRNILFQLYVKGQPGDGNKLRPDGPWGLIRRIRITTPRGEVYKDFIPKQMTWLNYFEHGTREYNTFPVSYTIGLYELRADLLCPFENHTGKYWPEETVLNTNESTEIWVDITWGDAEWDMFQFQTTQLTEIYLSVTPLERQPVNLSDQLEPRKKMVDLSDERNITEDEFDIQYLLPENTLIKTILVAIYDKAEEVTYYSERFDYLARAKIVDDDNANVWVNLSGTQIKSENKQYYGVEDYLQNDIFGMMHLAGLYVIEFDKMRDLTSCYNTVDKNYPKLLLEINKPDGSNDMVCGIFIRQITTPPQLQIVPPPPNEVTSAAAPRPQPIARLKPAPVPVTQQTMPLMD